MNQGYWDSLSNIPSTLPHGFYMGRGLEIGKDPTSGIQAPARGLRAGLLRLLLFGVLQALQENLFQNIKLLRGHLEQGGHVTNEDSGPGIIVSLKGNRMPIESVQV